MSGLVKIVSPITSILGDLFGGKSNSDQLPPPPQVEKPTLMPTPDDETVQAARRKAAAAVAQRSGRLSTILTNPGDDKLGA